MTIVCRGVRGATTATNDDREEVLRATRELLALMIRLNGINATDVASATFTTTFDIRSVFPALAARQLGWIDVPLLCGHEMDVVGALPLCIRIMIHWNTDRSQQEIQHVYLREARALRPDKTLMLGNVDLAELNEWIEAQLSVGKIVSSVEVLFRRVVMTKVAFQGEAGAYSEEAIRQHFGNDVETLPCRAFEHIFEAVEEGEADYAAVPVENSTAGSINKAYDLLLEHDLNVHGEILLRVHHYLLTSRDNDEGVREVRSHHQALAQCEDYLNRNNYVAVPWYDTAGSAKDLATNPEPGIAVIASKLAAEVYALAIVDERVEDIQNNYTRFFIVGKGDAPRGEKSKTSLIFAVPDIPDALYDALSQFASREINLTKLESRPRRNRPWQYVFYLDFEGHWQDPACSDALVALLHRAAFVKLLGSFPPAKHNGNGRSTAQSASLQI